MVSFGTVSDAVIDVDKFLKNKRQGRKKNVNNNTSLFVGNVRFIPASQIYTAAQMCNTMKKGGSLLFAGSCAVVKEWSEQFLKQMRDEGKTCVRCVRIKYKSYLCAPPPVRVLCADVTFSVHPAAIPVRVRVRTTTERSIILLNPKPK